MCAFQLVTDCPEYTHFMSFYVDLFILLLLATLTLNELPSQRSHITPSILRLSAQLQPVTSACVLARPCRVPGPYFCRRFLSSPSTRPLLLVFLTSFQVFPTNTSPSCVACLVHARDRQQRQLTATSHSASHSSAQPATDAQLVHASLHQQTSHTLAHIVPLISYGL